MKPVRIYKEKYVAVGSYFILFATRYKRKLFLAKHCKRIKKIISSFCEERQVELLEVSVSSNAVQLRICQNPKGGIHEFIWNLKATIARTCASEYPELFSKVPTLWHPSYLLVLSDDVSFELIQRYLDSLSNSQRTAPLHSDYLLENILEDDE